MSGPRAESFSIQPCPPPTLPRPRPCRIAHRTHSPAVPRFLATRKRRVRKPNLTHTPHADSPLPAINLLSCRARDAAPYPPSLFSNGVSHTPHRRHRPSATLPYPRRSPREPESFLHGQPAPQPSEQGLFPRRLRRRTARGHRRVQCRTWQRSLARLRSLARYRPAARSLCCWLHGSLC